MYLGQLKVILFLIIENIKYIYLYLKIFYLASTL